MKISSREKVLLLILITVVILFGGFKLLIEPELNALKLAQEDLIEVQAEKDTADYNLQIKDSIFQDNAKLKNEIIEKSTPFFDSLESDAIELFFNQLLNDVPVTAQSFMMTKPTIVQIDNPNFTEDTLAYPMKDFVAQIEKKPVSKENSKPSTGNSKALPDDSVEMVTVSIQLETSIGNGLAFIEKINESEKTLRVTAFNIVNNPTQGTTSISIIIQCFGLSKLAAVE